ncbi:DUF1684 domain-containing protein [Candidatus Uabimicrobium amorphum]|uniref:DUF1684 domain-containing protein n=1 Tax=Uabimicrobium amorphum TaxID=2596890 RepID=A0A5S9IUC0_UABAM|nr:DUF1684 domain-containing protein [Candidatus Uabimicrobium amorphum]BBM87320.1 hypothetical protein UABAM_05729 [Candidatus Uabimicrobium amorphum]
MKIMCTIVFFCFSLIYADSYLTEIQAWQQQRIRSLKKNWLSLVDLHWMNKENTTIGSGSDCDIIVSQKRFPALIGTFVRKGDSVFFTPHAKNVTCDKENITTTTKVFQNDQTGNLAYKSLSWFVISRSGKLAIRVRDYENEDVAKLKKLPRFATNLQWKVTAKFLPYTPPKKIEIVNVLGMASEDEVPGKLVFEIAGKQHSLEPVKSGESLFIMFKDTTTGHTTYSVGRYLYAKFPDENGNVVIDFNKAYNPPCAYTPYATCPMAPKQNHLPIAIEAGEKYSQEAH